MGAAILVHEYFAGSANFSAGETDVWVDSPTKQGEREICFLLFSFVKEMHRFKLIKKKKNEIKRSNF